MTTKMSPRPFSEFIKEVSHPVLRIKSRLYLLEALQINLKNKTANDAFTIRNDLVWLMVTDTFDMLVIDLASLCKHMLDKFFGRLNSYIPLLKSPDLETLDVAEPILVDNPYNDQEKREWLIKYLKDLQRERVKLATDDALKRLFPKFNPASGSKVQQADVADLKASFFAQIRDLQADRNDNRAHRYQSMKGNLDTKQLQVKDIRLKFEYIERMLNDFTLIVESSTMAFSRVTFSCEDQTSADLADLIFHGSINNTYNTFGLDKDVMQDGEFKRRYFWQSREHYYKDNKVPPPNNAVAGKKS